MFTLIECRSSPVILHPVCFKGVMWPLSSNIREPKPLWLAQTVATQMTTMCPWILARRHSALPRLTVLRISTFLWALGHITLIFQDSLQHYLPVRGAVPPCVTGRAVSVMLHHHPSTVTSNPIGNVSFWQWSFHISKSMDLNFSHQFFGFKSDPRPALLIVLSRQWFLLTLSALVFHSEANTSWFEEQWDHWWATI